MHLATRCLAPLLFAVTLSLGRVKITTDAKSQVGKTWKPIVDMSQNNTEAAK